MNLRELSMVKILEITLQATEHRRCCMIMTKRDRFVS
jgi:hypothetical protein